MKSDFKKQPIYVWLATDEDDSPGDNGTYMYWEKPVYDEPTKTFDYDYSDPKGRCVAYIGDEIIPPGECSRYILELSVKVHYWKKSIFTSWFSNSCFENELHIGDNDNNSYDVPEFLWKKVWMNHCHVYFALIPVEDEGRYQKDSADMDCQE